MIYLCNEDGCENIPMFGFEFYDNNLFIDYFCGKHYNEINFNLFNLKKIEKNDDIYFICKTHQKKYTNYCNDWHLHFCPFCLNHNKHNQIKLENLLLSNIEIENINKNLNEYEDYCNKIKTIYNALNENSTNNDLNSAYINYSNNILKIKDFLINLFQIYKTQTEKNNINSNIIFNIKNIFQFQFNICFTHKDKDNNINIKLNKNKITNFIHFCNTILNIPLKQSPLDYECLKIVKEKLSINYQIKINSKKIIKSINKEIITCLIILKDTRLASSTYNGNINIYKSNCSRIMLLINVDKENNKIYHILQLKDERIVSSLSNKRIKIIKLITPSNYIIEMELIGHEKEVLKTIEIFNEDLISYSDDLSIIIWKKVKEKYINIKNLLPMKNIYILELIALLKYLKIN